jgi:hypothetical protein
MSRTWGVWGMMKRFPYWLQNETTIVIKSSSYTLCAPHI